MLFSSTYPCLLESDLFALTFTVHGGVSPKRSKDRRRRNGEKWKSVKSVKSGENGENAKRSLDER